jgi:voltage-gated potassium channel
MTSLQRFNHHFLSTLWKIKTIVFGLLAVLLVDAVVIAYFEKMSFADALYFTFVTGLTIGYGDISPVTLMGRVMAVLAGLQGILITGLITAVAVYALRQAMEASPESE